MSNSLDITLTHFERLLAPEAELVLALGAREVHAAAAAQSVAELARRAL